MKQKLSTLLLTVLIFSGCATGTGGFNSASKTTELRPGMTTEEVTELLGRPASSQFIDGYMVWKYSLQRPWVGWIAYYLAFDGRDSKLVGWQENMQEYYQSQSLWLEALPKQHNINVQGNIHHDIEGNVQHEIYVR